MHRYRPECLLKTIPIPRCANIFILVLRAKYDMAKASVEEKKEERMRETIDEYYSFKNEFPDSKYTKEVESIYKDANKYVKEFNE